MNDNNQQTPEVVDAEAIEIKTLSLVDATLQTAKASFAELVKESSVDKKARELKAQLKKLTIADVNDKENYTKVKSISKDASKIRIAIEKRRKELKADIITAGKSVDNLANEYQALINPIENEADKKLEVIDTAIAEAEMQAQIKAKEKLDLRVKMLLESGIVFTGQWYAIGDIAVGIQMIQEMDDSSYEDLLSKVKTQNEANIAEQKRKDEEAEKERQAQEDLRLANEAKQKALQEQEDALNAKLKAIADAEAELERKAQAQKDLEEKQEQERKEEARKQQEREREILIGQRMSRYEDLGMKYSYVKKELEWSNSIGQVMIQKDVFIDEPTSLYEDTVNAINKYTEEEKEQIEKAEAERQVKIMADELKAEQQRIALQNDTEKFVEYLSALQNVPKPIITDTTLVGKMNAIINLINQ